MRFIIDFNIVCPGAVDNSRQSHKDPSASKRRTVHDGPSTSSRPHKRLNRSHGAGPSSLQMVQHGKCNQNDTDNAGKVNQNGTYNLNSCAYGKHVLP